MRSFFYLFLAVTLVSCAKGFEPEVDVQPVDNDETKSVAFATRALPSEVSEAVIYVYQGDSLCGELAWGSGTTIDLPAYKSLNAIAIGNGAATTTGKSRLSTLKVTVGAALDKEIWMSNLTNFTPVDKADSDNPVVTLTLACAVGKIAFKAVVIDESDPDDIDTLDYVHATDASKYTNLAITFKNVVRGFLPGASSEADKRELADTTWNLAASTNFAGTLGYSFPSNATVANTHVYMLVAATYATGTDYSPVSVDALKVKIVSQKKAIFGYPILDASFWTATRAGSSSGRPYFVNYVEL